MKRYLCASFLILLVSGVAAAQEFPRFEIFGGYSVQKLDFTEVDYEALESYYESRFEGSGYTPAFSRDEYLMNGFNGSMTINVNSVFGIAADVRYNSGDILNVDVADAGVSVGVKYKDLAFLAGPRLSFRSERVTPFVHALFGMDYWKASVQAVTAGNLNIPSSEAEDKLLGMAFGGGLDVNLSSAVALRLAQVDYYVVKYEAKLRKNLNFAGGIVFRLGWFL